MADRNAKGQFLKGVTHAHKPTGRPKGYKSLAMDIQRRTGNGEKLMDFLLDVFNAEASLDGVKMSERMWACEQLLNRGWGRFPSVVEVHTLDSDAVPNEVDVDDMTNEELEALEEAGKILEKHSSKRKVIDV